MTLFKIFAIQLLLTIVFVIIIYNKHINKLYQKCVGSISHNKFI